MANHAAPMTLIKTSELEELLDARHEFCGDQCDCSDIEDTHTELENCLANDEPMCAPRENALAFLNDLHELYVTG